MFDQETLEKRLLAHMITSESGLESAIDYGVTRELFYHSIPGTKKPQYAQLFDIIMATKSESDSLLTKGVFMDKMTKRMMTAGTTDIDHKKAQLSAYYDEISMHPHEPGEISYLIHQLQDNNNARLVSRIGKDLQAFKQEADAKGLDDGWTYAAVKLAKHLETNITDTHSDLTIKTRDLMRDTDWMKDELKNRIEHPEDYQGVYIGIPPIDEVNNGFRSGQLIVFIGQVAAGKTTLLTNLAYNVCNKYEKNILFFSLEMLEWMMVNKLNARDMNMEYSKLRDGSLNKQQQEIIYKRLDDRKNHKAGFWHATMAGTSTIAHIEQEMRSVFLDHKIDIVFVDYLGIIEPAAGGAGTARWEQLGKVAVKLRDLAKEFEIPIVTAVQANRSAIKKTKDAAKSEAPGESTYGVESVAESITIANTADVILGIHTDFEDGSMWIQQVKNREGQIQPFRLDIQAALSYVGYDSSGRTSNFISPNDIIGEDDDDDIMDSLDYIKSATIGEDDNDDADDDFDRLDTLDKFSSVANPDISLDINNEEDDGGFGDLDNLGMDDNE